MVDLPLENTKKRGETLSRNRQKAPPVHSLICALSMMIGLIIADVISDRTFLLLVLTLSIMMRFMLFHLKRDVIIGFLIIFTFFLGGFASYLEQTRHDRPLLSEITDLEITATIDALEKQSKTRWRLWLVNINYAKTTDILPRKIRIVSDFNQEIEIAKGDKIKAKIRLFPLSGPLFLGWPDYSRKAWIEDIDATGYARQATIIKSQNYKLSLFDRIRGSLIQQIDNDLSPKPAVITKALLLGKRDRQDAQLWSDFMKSGLSHLLAISGLHMGLFCFGVYLVIRMIMVIDLKSAGHLPHHKLAAMFALASGLFYLLLAHHPISAIRAYMMAVIILIAIMSDRRTVTLRNLNIVFMLFLISTPSSLYQPSFQLSFAATYDIIMLYDSPLRAMLMKSPFMVRMIGFLALTSIAAIIATFPISAYHFGFFSIWGLFANLIAIPLTAMVIMPLIIGYLLLSLISGGFLIAPILDFVLHLLIGFAHQVASWPLSDIHIKMPTPFMVVAIIIITGSVYLLHHKMRFVILSLLLPIIFLWIDRDVPIAMAELRNDRIAFAFVADEEANNKRLIHSFNLTSFWENSLRKLFVTFEETERIKCYYGCDFIVKDTLFFIHNGKAGKRFRCHDKAIHLTINQPNISHCPLPQSIFVIDENDHKYLMYREGDSFTLCPQQRAPLQKAWRP